MQLFIPNYSIILVKSDFRIYHSYYNHAYYNFIYRFTQYKYLSSNNLVLRISFISFTGIYIYIYTVRQKFPDTTHSVTTSIQDENERENIVYFLFTYLNYQKVILLRTIC